LLDQVVILSATLLTFPPAKKTEPK